MKSNALASLLTGAVMVCALTVAWLSIRYFFTLRELQKRCREQLQVAIGITALWHRLEQLGLSYKKNDARRRASAA